MWGRSSVVNSADDGQEQKERGERYSQPLKPSANPQCVSDDSGSPISTESLVTFAIWNCVDQGRHGMGLILVPFILAITRHETRDVVVVD